MKWVEMLDRWKAALAKRLGRSEDEIVSEALVESDFPTSGVGIRFKDGSNLEFRNAFYVGYTSLVPTGGGYISSCVAVFTAHCGYHEFWIGPGDRIEDIVEETGLLKDKSVHDLKGLFAAPKDACVSVEDMNPSRRKP